MDEEVWKEELKRRRRELRNNPTPTEARLWGMLRDRRLHGSRWRRQSNVGSYILDFYCPKAKLAVELDGPVHVNTFVQDAERTRVLEMFGIKVLRFRNPRVLEDWEKVEARILAELRKRMPKREDP